MWNNLCLSILAAVIARKTQKILPTSSTSKRKEIRNNMEKKGKLERKRNILLIGWKFPKKTLFNQSFCVLLLSVETFHHSANLTESSFKNSNYATQESSACQNKFILSNYQMHHVSTDCFFNNFPYLSQTHTHIFPL